MVLGNFSKDNWKLSQSRVNLDLNHILVAGKFDMIKNNKYTLVDHLRLIKIK